MNHHHMKHSAQPEVERPLSPARQAWLMLVVIAPMCGSMRSCRRSTRCCGRELNQRLRPRPTQSTLLRPSRRPMATQERIPRQSPNRRSKPHRKKNDPTTRFQPDAPISGMKSLDGVNTPWRPLCFPTYNQLKLKLSRQPKVSALFRIFAGRSRCCGSWALFSASGAFAAIARITAKPAQPMPVRFTSTPPYPRRNRGTRTPPTRTNTPRCSTFLSRVRRVNTRSLLPQARLCAEPNDVIGSSRLGCVLARRSAASLRPSASDLNGA